jgi:hypothetical protein
MSFIYEEGKRRRNNSKLIFSLGLYFVTFLMWLFWETNVMTVLLTGVAALTVIVSRYNQEVGDKTQKEIRFR